MVSSNPTYHISFKCHNGICHKHAPTTIDIAMADNSTWAIECAHCKKRFILEHLSDESGHAWLHAGTHSRIIHYQQVGAKRRVVPRGASKKVVLARV